MFFYRNLQELQSFIVFYSHRQNATLISKIKQNISSKFVHFDNKLFQFYFFHRFWTEIIFFVFSMEQHVLDTNAVKQLS